MKTPKQNTVLLDAIKSFCALDLAGSLSLAAEQLGVTRYLVVQHINSLEKHFEQPLFVSTKGEYKATDLAVSILPEARRIVNDVDAWFNAATNKINGLDYVNTSHRGIPFYLQQHPLNTIWESGTDLIKTGFQMWSESKCLLEAKSLAPLRPWLMVFRPNDGEWICTEIGNKSSFTTWFGWTEEKSNIGRKAKDLPGGVDFSRLLLKPFDDISATSSVRLDHILTDIPRADSEQPTPISYQRLTMATHFPNGDPALSVLVCRTHQIDISFLSKELLASMPVDLVMADNPDVT